VALSFLTINVNHQGDLLASLPGLLRNYHPEFVFMQEVAFPLHSLTAVVSGLGYTVWLSEAAQLRQCIAILALQPAVVLDFIPGYVQ
jgi:nitrate reductase NapE component